MSTQVAATLAGRFGGISDVHIEFMEAVIAWERDGNPNELTKFHAEYPGLCDADDYDEVFQIILDNGWLNKP